MSSVRRTGSDHRVTDTLVIGGGVLTLAVAYAPGLSAWIFSRGSTCPLQHAFGWKCPFCGMTHGTVALLHGDIGQLVRANPFAAVYVIALIAMVTSTFGLRTPGLFRMLQGRAGAALSYGVLALFVVYSVARNLI